MTLLSRKLFAGLLALLVAMPLAVGQARAAYTQAELDQMLAPIALYPDPLLSQILMASTYPIEVVEAARWSRANPGVQGDAAVRMVQDRDWDPSVKSLVAFPHVLARMDENIEWTRRLGEAFIVQEPVVMETVQALRRRAQASGQLASDDRLRVVEEAQLVAIEPANPQYFYVPYYDPWIAYGPWWWPAYPPVVWAPWPGYARFYRPGLSVGFWWGAPVGISVGFFFGGVDWYQRHVRVVHVNNYYIRPAVATRTVILRPGRWQHDPWHRRGAEYRDPVARQQFAAPAPRRDQRREEQRREEPRRIFAAPPAAAPRAEIRRDEPRLGVQRPPERRQERSRADRQPEQRKPEARLAPASPPSAERMPPARVERAPVPRAEPAPVLRAERAPAPRAERKDQRQNGRGDREHQGSRDRPVQLR
ncbi:MAG TPA: DUF3300 domain-containing protein [Burkholderiales bacterium]|nr:DUF3300 domain-containing protein [Burkholderiales bacterium]